MSLIQGSIIPRLNSIFSRTKLYTRTLRGPTSLLTIFANTVDSLNSDPTITNKQEIEILSKCN